MKSALSCVLSSCVALILIAHSPVNSQSNGAADGMRFVPDVAGQFFNLTQYPEALGLDRTTTSNPSACKHYQGLARADGPDGTPFFYMTKSGNTPAFPLAGLVCDDSPDENGNGKLMIFKMNSRDQNGERLRSNRLQKGIHVDNTVSPDEDEATIFFTVTEDGLVFRNGETTVQKVYRHPGGMQSIGNTLAIAADTPRIFKNDICTLLDPNSTPNYEEICGYTRASERAIVMFYDLSTPEDPILKSKFFPRDKDGVVLTDADALGVTKLPDGKYLMVVGTGYNTEYGIVFDQNGNPIPVITKPRYFYFYRSNSSNLQDENLDWTLVSQVLAPSDNEDAHQALNFIREGDINGQLYLAGSRGHIQVLGFFGDHDRLDLWKVDCGTANCLVGEDVNMTVRYHGRRLTPYASTGGLQEYANLAAAAGFYVSPSGELLFYAAQHDNDGPDGRINVGEWRHNEVIRPGSPTLLPTATVDGPYEVDEGSGLALTGTASPPVTRAWIQLYEAEDYTGPHWIVDYDDRYKDDYDNFSLFERITFPFTLEHHNTVRSWKWYAPVGCSIRAIDKNSSGEIDETVTLVGTGSVERSPAITQVPNDGGTDNIDREMDAVEFLGDCDSFYNTPFLLQWDLNGDGTIDTTGTSVTFSAAGLDGPSVVNIGAQAISPSGGQPGVTGTTATIKNVAPAVGEPSITDAGGNSVGNTVPFILTNSPLNLRAAFTDPGIPDRQTASINWGDGSTQSNASFTLFDEAFGDGFGELRHSHSYSAPGTYSITLEVRDDDGGYGNRQLSVNVLTPEHAIIEMINMLDQAIANCSNAAACSDLSKARSALAGVRENSFDGALKQLRKGNKSSAVAFLGTAKTWLDRAVADGATGLSTLQALVVQVSSALSS